MKTYTNPNGEKMVVYKSDDLPPVSAERLAELAAMSDDEIDTTDIPEVGDEFWEKAVLSMPEGKEHLTIRLDQYVVDWFKQRGRGYQGRINAVLRAYVHTKVLEEAEAKGKRAAQQEKQKRA